MKNKQQPLVSVIMPVYNAKAYIKDAVDSILNQTYAHIEFIIVDDQSTDGTQDILLDYAKRDSRIILLQPKQKGYLSGSLNLALKRAKGMYIARMDADDISLPERIQRQVEYLQSHTNIVAVGCQEEIINEQGTIVADKFFPEDPAQAYEMIMNFMVIQPPTLMARASVMKKLTYDTGVAKHDDIDMHFQLLQYGSFANIPDIAFQYRVSPESYTHRKIKSVYFMALLIRLRAIRRYGYRPTLSHIGLALVETVTVAMLPERILLSLFTLLRYKKQLTLNKLTQFAYQRLFAFN